MRLAAAIRHFSITASVACCAALCLPDSSWASNLSVVQLFTHYTTRTTTQATGTLDFHIRFDSLGGDANMGFDFFSAQIMINKMLSTTPAAFTLNEFQTEDTASIGPTYWLNNVPTQFPNASTQGDQFRFSDFVSLTQSISPAAGNILAHFVIDFSVSSPDQFGEYEIARGDPTFNRFGSNLINQFPNTTGPGTFKLEPIPEPATGGLFALGGILGMTLRRRRRAPLSRASYRAF